MKRLLLLILAALCCVHLSAGLKDFTRITIEKKVGKTPIEKTDRSLTDEVEAYYIFQSKTIELYFYDDLGVAEVSIVNSHNEIMDFITVDSSIEYSTMLNVPAISGHYTLRICSPDYYGEGEFSID